MDLQWPPPWNTVSDSPEQIAALRDELAREAAPGHALFGVPVRTLARRADCDDVVFSIDDGTGRVAVVHLTWIPSGRDRPPWPITTIYDSLEEWRRSAHCSSDSTD